jgi:hypothetical protein
MIDDNDTEVIINFDSCCPFGETLVKFGIPGWSDENTKLSSVEFSSTRNKVFHIIGV